MLNNAKQNRFVLESDLIKDLIENNFEVLENDSLRKNYNAFRSAINKSKGGYILNKENIDYLGDIVSKKTIENIPLDENENEIYKKIINSQLKEFLQNYKLDNLWSRVESIRNDEKIYTENQETDWFAAFSLNENELLKQICTQNFNYYAEKDKILSSFKRFSFKKQFTNKNRKLDHSKFFKDFSIDSSSFTIVDPYLLTNNSKIRKIDDAEYFINISRSLLFYYIWINNIIKSSKYENYSPEINIISVFPHELKINYPENEDKEDFKFAFNNAHRQLGDKKIFEFNGNEYSTSYNKKKVSAKDFKERISSIWKSYKRDFRGESKENLDILIKLLKHTDFFDLESLSYNKKQKIRQNVPYKNIMHDLTILTDYGFLSNPSRDLNFNYFNSKQIAKKLDEVKRFDKQHSYFLENNYQLQGDFFYRHHCLDRDFSEAENEDFFNKRYESVKILLNELKKLDI